MSEPTPEQILSVPMDAAYNPAGAVDIRGYLVALLTKLWTELDQFSGKRPFGISYWQFDLHAALGRAGHIRATFDEFGYLEECDTVAGERLITAAIKGLDPKS